MVVNEAFLLLEGVHKALFADEVDYARDPCGGTEDLIQGIRLTQRVIIEKQRKRIEK